MCPGVAGIDDTLVHCIKNLERRDDCTIGKHFDLDPPTRHLVDAVGITLQQFEIDAGRRYRGLHPNLLLRQGSACVSGENERNERCQCLFQHHEIASLTKEGSLLLLSKTRKRAGAGLMPRELNSGVKSTTFGFMLHGSERRHSVSSANLLVDNRSNLAIF